MDWVAHRGFRVVERLRELVWCDLVLYIRGIEMSCSLCFHARGVGWIVWQMATWCEVEPRRNGCGEFSSMCLNVHSGTLEKCQSWAWCASMTRRTHGTPRTIQSDILQWCTSVFMSSQPGVLQWMLPRLRRVARSSFVCFGGHRITSYVQCRCSWSEFTGLA